MDNVSLGLEHVGTCRYTVALKVWILDPAASASFGNLSKMQFLGPHPRPTESATLGAVPIVALQAFLWAVKTMGFKET
jgi:hypothetical protein